MECFSKTKKKNKHVKRLNFITVFKIEFLPPFTSFRKALGKMPTCGTLFYKYFLLAIIFYILLSILSQEFIQAILTFGRRHKKLNLLIEFSNSIFIKFYFKAYWP